MKTFRAFVFFFAIVEISGVLAKDAKLQEPTFEAFPVREQFQGPVATLRLTTRQDREFRTALKRATRQKPNFAGHYILTTVGCGAACVMTAVIDAKTGKVQWLPFTLCCWDADIQEPVEYRIDSDLIILHGQKNEQYPGTWSVRFTNGRFGPVALIAERK
jgi:hypothetical protein